MRPKEISSEHMLDLYTDFLLCSFSKTTATGMASMLNDTVSHDQITRFLSEKEYGGKDLWKQVKPVIRKIETEYGCLIGDDTIQEKPYTDENDIVAWHFDHTKGRSVKGVNIVNCAYTNGKETLPLDFAVVKKTEKYVDEKTGKQKRRSLITKNEIFRNMFDAAIKNAVKFRYVLVDVWFGSVENMKHIHDTGKYFVLPLKENRLIALSREDKLNGRFQAISSMETETNHTRDIYIQGFEFPVKLAVQVFTNKDGSTGRLRLVTNDLTLDYSGMTRIYQKRWKVEEFHKSIKSNAGLSESPTQTVRTQSNHFFASICAYVKLECLKWKRGKNHFALKSELYLQAIQNAFFELRKLQGKAV